MSRFHFVADNSATFEVKRLCQAVQVTRSSYYAWQTVQNLLRGKNDLDFALQFTNYR